MSERSAEQRRHLSRRRLVVSAALAAAALAAGGLYAASTGDGGPTGGVRAASALPPLEVETGVVHVHGLGVDPADGVLYAATHSGLFRLPERGEAVRVANRAQDTMGFTVAGPGEFLASGHPDPREDDVRPPLLGLVVSRDRGETWERLSLHGQADFHALQAAHGRVYGYDATSQSFLVTEDRERWDRRARLPMGDFAVDPAEADTVLATTEQGLARSTDGGRSWRAVPGAPAVTVLSWPLPDRLYAVGPDGRVLLSADGGATWSGRGAAGGEPEAVTVDAREGEERLYVAVRGGGIVVSRDGGRTFTSRYRDPAGPAAGG